jgi:hypothetical protein
MQRLRKVQRICDVGEREKVLYLQPLMAWHGCLKSALLWYELFTGMLQGMDFKLNLYDTCVANKMVEEKECTVAWYVVDNKISHGWWTRLRSILGR